MASRLSVSLPFSVRESMASSPTSTPTSPSLRIHAQHSPPCSCSRLLRQAKNASASPAAKARSFPCVRALSSSSDGSREGDHISFEGNGRAGEQHTTTMKTRFHSLIEDNSVVLMPGCYDALSAAIVENAGFHAGFISGYALSASLLGKPDFGFLTPPEMAMNARFICAAASRIPIIADADTGGGNALNVQRTVKDLIAAGAAGCFLEDQVWPKKCGHMRGKQVIPAEEHAQKIAAARDAIGDKDFFLVARTDARATSAKNGLEEAIARANLYMEAGADASFVEAPRDDDELREIGKRTKGYRVCNMLEGGITPLHTPEELKEMGFHLIVHPLTTLYATARALTDIMKTLKEKGTTRDDLKHLSTFEEFNKLMNLESWFQLETRYSPQRKSISSTH